MAFPLKEQGGKLDAEQKKVVRQILRTGRRKHATGRELVTALITGAQESGLRNLPIGAESSGGWRQERAIYYPDPLNVKHSSERFFDELRERSTPGMSVGEAAQAAQRSAYPDAYQPHVGEARAILKRFNRSMKKAAQNGSPGLSAVAAKTQKVQRLGGGKTLAPVAPKPVDIKSTKAYKLAALDFVRSNKSASDISQFLQTKEGLQSAAQSAVKPAPTPKQKLSEAPNGIVTTKGNFKEKPIPQVKGSSGKQLVRWAKAVEGTNEGSPRQSKWAAAAGISPSTAWCSAFVAYGLRKQGYSMPANPAYSGDWLNWKEGKRVNYKNVKPGDLIILDWGDGGITDHIGIYAGNGQYIAGNNSNNSVGITSVPTGNIVGVVRPTKKR